MDVGCGAGTWLSVFSSFGKNIEGYDFGSGVVNEAVIPSSLIKIADLTKPLDFGRRYDLALNLEVAEHLEESSADVLVQSLSCARDMLLFSAAIPRQGGTHHVNCQWPSYWAKKFAAFGFVAFDILRPIFWLNSSICPWYRQNMILYIRNPGNNVTQKLASMTSFNCLPLVHPEMR